MSQTNVVPFQFEQSTVRTIVDDGQVLFVGRDVAKLLGYVNFTDALKQHCKGVAKRYPLVTDGGRQEVRFISEPDVLRLIVSSRMPAAERFERWVFEEVLPSIRKTGSYAAPGAQAMRPSGYESLDESTKRAVDAQARHQAQRTMAYFQHVLGDLADTLGLSPDRVESLDVPGLVRSGLIPAAPELSTNVVAFKPIAKRPDKTGAERQRRWRERQREGRLNS